MKRIKFKDQTLRGLYEMNCTNCQAENPKGAKFCMNCGHTLNINCPNCGSELPSHAKFCIDCGHQMDAADGVATHQSQSTTSQERLQQFMPKDLQKKLETARSSGGMRGERRVVTILFCDVAGFDPCSRETGSGRLDRYNERGFRVSHRTRVSL